MCEKSTYPHWVTFKASRTKQWMMFTGPRMKYGTRLHPVQAVGMSLRHFRARATSWQMVKHIWTSNSKVASVFHFMASSRVSEPLLTASIVPMIRRTLKKPVEYLCLFQAEHERRRYAVKVKVVASRNLISVSARLPEPTTCGPGPDRSFRHV